MRHLMLLFGLGTALLATACGPVPETPLTQAAAANDSDAAARLLTAGTPADDRSGMLTALMWAARRGSADVIGLLLDRGADVNAKDGRNGWTALQHAIHTRQVAAVRLLLDRGANPNAADHPGALTPLLMASIEPDPTIVSLLLAHGADPHVEGEWGDTPLTRAVSGGAVADVDRGPFGGCHPATLRTLLEHEPTLRLPDNRAGREALMWARLHLMHASLRENVVVRISGDADQAAAQASEWSRCREVLDLVRDGIDPTRAQR